MNTEIIKYDRQKENSRLKSKGAKKTLFAKVPARANLTYEEQEILKAALEARDEWVNTSANFEHVCEEMLIDYYTYKLKACEARYTYFVRLAKEMGLSNYI